MRMLITTDTVGGVWTLRKSLHWELLNDGCAVALVSLGRLPSSAQASSGTRAAARPGGTLPL